MNARRTRLTRSATKRLVALLDGEPVGTVYQMGSKRLAFEYDDNWRAKEDAYPLSLSMPLAAREHGEQAIRAYLWNLLPDNPDVLEEWAHKYHVSRFDVVQLLGAVGEDVAGAVQFAVPDRVDELLRVNSSQENVLVEWIDEPEIERRLRELRVNPAAGRSDGDPGQFSLPGVQAKTALYQADDGRWGVPGGATPTNRIVKRPDPRYRHALHNEHFCLLLATELGMVVAPSRVAKFGTEPAIVLKRYDRDVRDGRLVRIHQEDLCQAFGIEPARRYQKRGGPSIREICDLLRTYSNAPDQDVFRFLDANFYNWLIGGTDAHAKNYSLLHSRGPQTRLAPLYDIMSALPYPDLMDGKETLSMSIGGEYLITAIDAIHWRAMADELSIDGDRMLGRIQELGQQIGPGVDRVLANYGDADSDVEREFVSELGERILHHAEERVRALSQ